MDIKALATQFCQFYYDQLQQQPAQRVSLRNLYQAGSSLHYEGGDAIQGADNIIAKFTSLPAMRFHPQTIDVQKGPHESFIVIFVTGQISIDSENPLKYAQTFQLVQGGPGQFYVHNDIFRLNYA